MVALIFLAIVIGIVVTLSKSQKPATPTAQPIPVKPTPPTGGDMSGVSNILLGSGGGPSLTFGNAWSGTFNGTRSTAYVWWNGSTFVNISRSSGVLTGAGVVRIGTNGSTWTEYSDLPTKLAAAFTAGLTPTEPCYDPTNGMFYIATKSNGFAYSGDGGVTWTTRTSLQTACGSAASSQNNCILARGNMILVGGAQAVAANNYALSTDSGATFSTAYRANLSAAGVGIPTVFGYGLGKYHAFAGGSHAYSTDGQTWTASNLSAVMGGNVLSFDASSNTLVVGGSSGTLAYSTNGTSWTANASLSSSGNWGSAITAFTNEVTAIYWTGNQFLAGGYLGHFARSVDGITWTVLSPSLLNGSTSPTWSANNSDVRSMATNGSNLLLVGGGNIAGPFATTS
jgi:hypothetical protein